MKYYLLFVDILGYCKLPRLWPVLYAYNPSVIQKLSAWFWLYAYTNVCIVLYGLLSIYAVCYVLGDAAGLFANIMRLRSRLADIIEPDFGLLNELLSLEALIRREVARIRSEKTVYEQNDALLDLLVSEDQCDKFVKALQRTDQGHIVNYITQNGGQERHTYQLVTDQTIVNL